MKIYLVRHGESEGNISNVHQPGSSPLSFEGIRQADKLAARFSGVSADLIIASPLMRTKQTAEAISRETGASIEYDARIEEIKRPSSVVGRSYNEVEVQAMWEKIRVHREESEYHLQDEENFFDLRARISSFLKDLTKRTQQDLIVVSHGYSIRAMVGLMIFGDDFNVHEFYNLIAHTSVANTGITICDYSDPHGWRVTTINDAAHLLD